MLSALVGWWSIMLPYQAFVFCNLSAVDVHTDQNVEVWQGNGVCC